MCDIRPVTHRFPLSSDVLHDSNLPFSCVVTPFQQRECTARARSSCSQRSNSSSDVNQPPGEEEEEKNNGFLAAPPPLSSVPKCIHCGAPHPTRDTHYRPKMPSPFDTYHTAELVPYIVCYLCGGKTSLSSTEKIQQQLGTKTASSQQSQEDKQGLESDGGSVGGGKTLLYQVPISNEQSSMKIPAMLCPPVWWILLDGSCTLRSYWKNMSSVLSQTIKTIPPHVHIGILIAATTTTTTTNSTGGNTTGANRTKGAVAGSVSKPNGGTGNRNRILPFRGQAATNRNNSSSNTSLNNIPTTSATTTTFSYVDLTSPVPHILHFSYHDDTTDSRTNDNNKLNESHHDYSEMASKINLVPADSLHMPNIQAAIRSLVDFDPPFITSSNLSTTATTSTTSTIITTSSASFTTNEGKATCISTMPLGRSIELILDVMDNAQHPGRTSIDAADAIFSSGAQKANYRNQQSSNDPNNSNPNDEYGINTNSNISNSNTIMYAGGKISCFVTSRPTELLNDPTSPSGAPSTTLSSSLSNTQPKTIGMGGFGGSIVCGGPDSSSNYGQSSLVGVQRPSSLTQAPKTTDTISDARTSAIVDDEEMGAGVQILPAKKSNKSNKRNAQHEQQIDDTDMTPSNLYNKYFAPKEVELYFQELGSQCAEAALGVDLFVLTKEAPRRTSHNNDDGNYYDDEYDYDDTTIQLATGQGPIDVGLSLLRLLCDRSGAPGPICFPIQQQQQLKQQLQQQEQLPASSSSPSPSSVFKTCHRRLLQEELLSRTPWHKPMAFGCELRLRLSPGFVVDTVPVEPTATTASDNNNETKMATAPQLATLYSSGGLMGPGTVHEECYYGDDDSNNLWRMGACDPYTSVTVDLDVISNKVQDRIIVADPGVVAGTAEIVWKPVIQTCFIYTTVVYDEKSQEYSTERYMRITSMRAPLTDDVETLYSSIDLEALAVVLCHKLTLTLLREGFKVTQQVGQDWLKSLLVCVYRSAKIEADRQRDKEEYYQNTSNHDNPLFYVSERLLDREGDLSAEDVLLAQGHERLRIIPLIIYSLLQCDAIRPSSSLISGSPSPFYRPTMDARCAALSQMSSMTPVIISKCIAPKLQLFSESDGLIMDMLDLSIDKIRMDVLECQATTTTVITPKKDFAATMPNDKGNTNNKELNINDEVKSSSDLILLLDSPQQIIVCDARLLIGNDSTSDNVSGAKTLISEDSDLFRSITKALQSYRTPPPILLELGAGGTHQEVQKRQGLFRFMNALVEDLPPNDDDYYGYHFEDNGGNINYSSNDLEKANFLSWKTWIASQVHEDLKDDLFTS